MLNKYLNENIWRIIKIIIIINNCMYDFIFKSKKLKLNLMFFFIYIRNTLCTICDYVIFSSLFQNYNLIYKNSKHEFHSGSICKERNRRREYNKNEIIYQIISIRHMLRLMLDFIGTRKRKVSTFCIIWTLIHNSSYAIVHSVSFVPTKFQFHLESPSNSTD